MLAWIGYLLQSLLICWLLFSTGLETTLVVGYFTVVALALAWVIWIERSAKIFKNRWRIMESVWDAVFIFSSLWVFILLEFLMNRAKWNFDALKSF